jgi:hypothetical protein
MGGGLTLEFGEGTTLNDTSRQALRGQANGSTEGYEISTFGDAGYDFHCGDLTFGPIVSMQYTNVHVSGFSEHGAFVLGYPQRLLGIAKNRCWRPGLLHVAGRNYPDHPIRTTCLGTRISLLNLADNRQRSGIGRSDGNLQRAK